MPFFPLLRFDDKLNIWIFAAKKKECLNGISYILLMMCDTHI